MHLYGGAPNMPSKKWLNYAISWCSRPFQGTCKVRTDDSFFPAPQHERLRIQDGYDALGVHDLRAPDPLERCGERHAHDLNELVHVQCGRPFREVVGKEQVDHLVRKA